MHYCHTVFKWYFTICKRLGKVRNYLFKHAIILGNNLFWGSYIYNSTRWSSQTTKHKHNFNLIFELAVVLKCGFVSCCWFAVLELVYFVREQKVSALTHTGKFNKLNYEMSYFI